MKYTRVCAAVAASVALFGLTACSSDDTKSSSAGSSAAKKPKGPFAGVTPDQIAAKATAATKSVTSMKIVGNGIDAGKKMAFTSQFHTNGQCLGSTQTAGEGRLDTRRTSAKKLFMRGDEAYYKSAMASGSDALKGDELDLAVKIMSNKWIKPDASDKSAGDIGDLCSMTGLVTEMQLDDVRGMRRGADTVVDGRKAITLVGKAGSQVDTYYVAADEKAPFYLKLTSVGGKDGASAMSFSEQNKPFVVAEPKGKELLDLNKMSG
ncbi:hypothetical protein ABT160_45745 [Streptomyces sp. NPDC001941]|uniref:hypothetical protein n=1 Tax=Streptomyces sp. NPDC001941 TaxID=3154659 RepID=UPI003324B75D